MTIMDEKEPKLASCSMKDEKTPRSEVTQVTDNSRQKPSNCQEYSEAKQPASLPWTHE